MVERGGDETASSNSSAAQELNRLGEIVEDFPFKREIIYMSIIAADYGLYSIAVGNVPRFYDLPRYEAVFGLGWLVLVNVLKELRQSIRIND